MVRLGRLRHFHPLHRQPAVQQGGPGVGRTVHPGNLRRRLRGPALRRLPLRLDRRPGGPEDLDDVRRRPCLARQPDDRRRPHVRQCRCVRLADAAGGPAGAGPGARRRAAVVADLPVRNGTQGAPRFLGHPDLHVRYRGILFGTLLGAVLNMSLSTQAMNAWGWRIPFLIGAAMGLYALIMRSRLHETDVFEGEAATEKRAPIWPQIVRHRKQALQVIGLTAGLTVIYYIWGVVAPSYATTALKIDRGEALWAGVIGNIVFIAALPFWGKLSDRIGRKKVLWSGAIGAGIMHFPMTALLKDSAWQLAVSMSVMLIFIAASAAIVPAVYAELFPTSIRTVGVGVPYSICVALFGGTAPYLQQWLGSSLGAPQVFNIYAVLLLVVSAAFVFTIPETKGKDLTH